eukprot:gene9019-biopygen14960
MTKARGRTPEAGSWRPEAQARSPKARGREGQRQ